MRYIALLRGINVGGNTMIKMADLKSCFEGLGFKNVVSYINSGNLAFDATKATEEKICTKIEKAVEKEFGKAIPVMIREQSSINKVLENNPFHGAYETHKQMHVLFMKEEMPKDKSAQLKAASTEQEQFEVIDREIYALLKGGMAESLMGRGLIEKQFKVSVTARNWRTVEKLAEL
jgi:uncharacterized protein (DUF1697 family)